MAGNSWSFDLATGPGYRQDRLEWSQEADEEIYPHLRMFDWTLSFDAEFVGLHLIGEGDMGWFSSQTMRKRVSLGFPAPVSFSYSASGRALTGSLCLGYRFGKKAWLMPIGGWIYDEATLHRSQSIPPCNRVEESLPLSFSLASIEMQSNLRTRWNGAILGAQLGWQPFKGLIFESSYAYAWLHFSQTLSELHLLQQYLPGAIPSTLVQTILIANGSGRGGHGNLGKFKMILALSKLLFFGIDFRYFSFQSGTVNEGLSAQLSSALIAAELMFRF